MVTKVTPQKVILPTFYGKYLIGPQIVYQLSNKVAGWFVISKGISIPKMNLTQLKAKE